MLAAILLTLAGAVPLASAHIAMFHPSMYGFNWTDTDSQRVNYDNRPVAPLQDMTFSQWWFHGHLDYPPNPGDFFELPAGQAATTELACDKSHTSFFASKAEDSGFDLQSGNDPCPADGTPFPNPAMHTNGFNDLKGCALAIAYESDVTKIKPEDFTVFSINQTCVWTRFTDFQVPARMPPCPEDGCHCAWFWIHADDSGGEQNYMNGFKCKVTNSTSNVALAKPKVPRRCGADPDYDKPDAAPGNCTYGAKQPFYWFQKEQNNMFEGQYAPPFYTDLYNFKDGAQDDIFVDSYPADLPEPSPNSTFVPTPFLGPAPGAASSASSEPVASSSGAQSVSTTDATTSSAAQSSAPTQSDNATSSSVAVTSSAVPSSTSQSSSVTISTLSQTATFSASPTSSIPEPSLPLSIDASSIPSFSQSSSPPASSSVVVSTSLVVSTVVVTVTAQPAPTSTDGGAGTAIASASSTVAFPNSSALASSAISVSDSVGVSTGVASATPPSSTFMATQSAPSAPTSTDTQSIVAASTIVLGPKPSGAAGGKVLAASTGSSTFVRPEVLAADSTSSGKVCKRTFGAHKVFRRRVAISSPPSQEPQTESSLFSRIPGLRRHRKLTNRSRLWSFF